MLKDEKRKFIESLSVDGWSIKTDTGYEKITHSNKTVDYIIWILITENHYLECANNHIVFKDDFSEVFVKDLSPGDFIITETGIEKVNAVIETFDKEGMYDLTVDSENHRYYTGGILSHNTTIGALKSMRHLVVTQEKQKSVNCWKPLKNSLPKQSWKQQMERLMKIRKNNYYEICGNTTF